MAVRSAEGRMVRVRLSQIPSTVRLDKAEELIRRETRNLGDVQKAAQIAQEYRIAALFPDQDPELKVALDAAREVGVRI